MSQFFKFVLAGGFAALVNVVCRYLLNLYMSYEIAIVIAYLIAMTVAYILSRRYVFEKTPDGVVRESMKFALVNAVAIVLVWITSVGLARLIFPAIGFTWYADDIAHMIGVMVPAISSYVGHKYFTFKAAHDAEI